jgi:hypothetical protein
VNINLEQLELSYDTPRHSAKAVLAVLRQSGYTLHHGCERRFHTWDGRECRVIPPDELEARVAAILERARVSGGRFAVNIGRLREVITAMRHLTQLYGAPARELTPVQLGHYLAETVGKP